MWKPGPKQKQMDASLVPTTGHVNKSQESHIGTTMNHPLLLAVWDPSGHLLRTGESRKRLVPAFTCQAQVRGAPLGKSFVHLWHC